MNLKETNCYNCNSSTYTFYDSDNGYKLVKCSGCGLLYVNPRPAEEEITMAMQSGLHRGENLLNVTGSYSRFKKDKYLKIFKDFFQENELSKENFSWLDIGCGYGELLEALKVYTKNKIKATGSEPNQYKVASAVKRHLNVSFIDLDSHKEKYDVISLLNVYSHLPNPKEFFEKLKRNLKPGGKLFIETGHSSHLPAKYHHKPYNLPDHLSFANKEIVENILQKTGFKIVKTEIYRSGIFPTLKRPLSYPMTMARIILRKGGSFSNFFPKYPDRDMFVLCKLE